MGWIDYFNLYVQYSGNLSKASAEELKAAAKNNPNDPISARALGEKKYIESITTALKEYIEKTYPLIKVISLNLFETPDKKAAIEFAKLRSQKEKGLFTIIESGIKFYIEIGDSPFIRWWEKAIIKYEAGRKIRK